jgi:hypothetical protein
MKSRGFVYLLAAPLLAAVCLVSAVRAQCPEEPRLDSFVGAGRITCPCFVEGEEAGAIFQLPPEEFPIEILRVGIGWGSQFGGTAPSVEDSIKIYPGGLPDPGAPVFTLSGPQLIDGSINEWDLEPFEGEIILDSSPFTVALKFFNTNANNIFAASVVHDGTGCQAGKNSVYAIPGGWVDGCSLGITGQWVFYVVYRKVDCPSGAGTVPDGYDLPGTPLLAERLTGGDITLTWSASCSATDDDYEIYEGTIEGLYDHEALFCTTGGATTITFTPSPGNTYYLVVPSGLGVEGSYGKSDGVERPEGSPACAAQGDIVCP